MIYIDDLIDGTVFFKLYICIANKFMGQMQFLEADSTKLRTRVYNFTAFSFTPEELYNEIKKYI